MYIPYPDRYPFEVHKFLLEKFIIYLSNTARTKKLSMIANFINGASMEIPQRLLVQNMFVILNLWFNNISNGFEFLDMGTVYYSTRIHML